MGRVLGIVYRCIATHLIKKAGFSCTSARTGAVTLIQRFGSALNLNVHFHMLFLDGVYVDTTTRGLAEPSRPSPQVFCRSGHAGDSINRSPKGTRGHRCRLALWDHAVGQDFQNEQHGMQGSLALGNVGLEDLPPRIKNAHSEAPPLLNSPCRPVPSAKWLAPMLASPCLASSASCFSRAMAA